MAMLDHLDSRDPALRQRLQHEPLAELAQWPELAITYIDSAQQRSDCTIAGAYIDTLTPPVIGIVRGTFPRREAFTVLHELGHHLQRTNVRLLEGLIDQPDRGRVLEELTCDAFAAAILIPPTTANTTLGGSTPTAVQIQQLWAQGSASRAAVCVRAGQNLQSPGHVTLLDEEGTIAFSYTYADYPLRRGLDQSSTEIIKAARSSRARLVSRKSSWIYTNGTTGSEMYAQATWLGAFIVVVTVVDQAPWETLSLSAPVRDFSHEWYQCITCGHVLRTLGAETCTICSDPKCDECDRCACPSRVAERLCIYCTMIKPAHLFEGASETCTDCS